MIARIISVVIILSVGFMMFTTINTEVNALLEPNSSDGIAAANLPALIDASSSTATMLKLVPGFFALGILGFAAITIYKAIKESGLISTKKSRAEELMDALERGQEKEIALSKKELKLKRKNRSEIEAVNYHNTNKGKDGLEKDPYLNDFEVQSPGLRDEEKKINEKGENKEKEEDLLNKKSKFD